jgi:hypothetical protein
MLEFKLNDENNKILTTKEQNARYDLTKPIIFLDQETALVNPSPISESFNSCYDYLDHTLKADKNTAIELEQRLYLINLSTIARDNIVFNIVEKIISDTIRSINSALEQGHLNYVGLKKYICFDIEPSLALYRKDISSYIRNCIFDIADIYKMRNNKNKKENDLLLYCLEKEPIRYLLEVANNIGIGIISRINSEIERSARYLCDIYRYDKQLFPDRNDLITLINDTFKGIDKNAGNHYWLYVEYALGKALYDDLSVSYNVIMQDIRNTLCNPDSLAYAFIFNALYAAKNSYNNIEKKDS